VERSINYTKQTIMSFHYTQIRSGERKWGEVLESRSWDHPDVQFVLVGIPEDVGVRANGGNPGAAQTPEAAIRALCNLQENRWTPKNVGLLGMVPVADLQEQANAHSSSTPEGLEALRALTAEVDQRVLETLAPVWAAGKIPIAVGGGHNNAFPLLVGASGAHGARIDALNIDAHTDWRPLEGRHSGNGFTAARAQNALDRYAVWGLQEAYTPESVLEVRGETSETDAWTRCLAFLRADAPFGLEVDLDAVRGFPSSAASQTGLSLESVRQGVYAAAQTQRPAYLHVCEGIAAAPGGTVNAGVAKAIAALVLDFVRGYDRPLE
jgi:formiminoglutamase